MNNKNETSRRQPDHSVNQLDIAPIIQDLSFGDFSQDELNNYLVNKKLKLNNNSTGLSSSINPNHRISHNDSQPASNGATSIVEPSNHIAHKSGITSEFDIEFGFDLHPSLITSASDASPNNSLKSVSSSSARNSQPRRVVEPPTNVVSESLSTSPPTSSHSSTYSSSPPSSPHSKQSRSSTANQLSSSSSNQMEAGDTVLAKASLDSFNSTNGPTSTSVAQSNGGSLDAQQRRNKKKKPPNYYQSAEYAAIIKLNGEAAAQKTSHDSTAESSTASDKSGHVNHNNHNETVDKASPQLNKPETSKPSNDAVITNGDHPDPVNIEHKLEKLEITNDEAPSTNTKSSESTPTSLTAPVSSPTPAPPSNPPAKPTAWSSLFKSSTQPQPSNTQPSNVNSKPTSQKSAPKSNSASSQPAATNLNGQGPDSSVPVNPDVLKSLGSLLKQSELKHSAPALQPRGLSNRNNWCYVNATLQALLACPPFYNLLKTIYAKLKLTNSSSQAMRQVPFITALGRFITEFKVMVRNSSSEKPSGGSKELVIGEAFECEYFYEVLRNSQSHMEFRPGRQEDAQEFLSFLLNRLHEEMIKCLENINPPKTDSTQSNGADTLMMTNGHESDGLTNGASTGDDDDEWREVGRKNRAFVTRKPEFKQSPLSDIFCGQFRSALSQPGTKDKESVSLEPFFTLPLEIQSDSIRTVQQAMEHFVQKEEISGFHHQETKQEVEAFKRISFEDLPPVLIIYLKCFVFDKHGGSQKLLKRVDFQIDLEISRELISSNQRSKLKDKEKRSYKLFAVEYHHGERASGGHYITDVYHPGIVGWVRYDDASVRVISNAQVLKSDDKKLIPYLLYYRRCDLI